MNDVLKTAPAVFAVNNTYQIMVGVKAETLMWVKVGDECYYDHSNGILRSDTDIHRMTVPLQKLDEERKYTVCYRKIIERKPYFSETSDVYEEEFNFRPVSGEKLVAYHISDAHNMVEQPVRAAKWFEQEYGKMDILILNGDVPDHSGNTENFDNIYEIISQITGGNIPVVFSRGNHDTRGICAEKLADYTPCENGKSYFTVKLGKLWAILLDCGEDKPDKNAEYGNTICCHEFRKDETAFIEKLIKDAESEYNAGGVMYKAVIVHNPFTKKKNPPFDIEEDIYEYWGKLLKENVKPDVMICGHTHKFAVYNPGDAEDYSGQQPCTVVEGAVPDLKEKHFAGAGFIFTRDGIEVIFNNDESVLETHKIK